MSTENLNWGSKRIDDRELARKMADAGNKDRTIAANNRADAKTLESPKTIVEKINKWLAGTRAGNKAEYLRSFAVLADKTADLKEEKAAIKHLTQQEARNLTEEELKILVEETSRRLSNIRRELIGLGTEGEIDINKLIEAETVLVVRHRELLKILKQREAVRERTEQERKR